MIFCYVLTADFIGVSLMEKSIISIFLKHAVIFYKSSPFYITGIIRKGARNDKLFFYVRT